MAKRIIVPILMILIGVNLVPYLARFIRGWDWLMQILPNETDDAIDVGILKIVFVLVFNSVTAITVVGAFLLRKYVPVTFVFSIVVTVALVGAFHYFLDLDADAQQAVALFFGPFAIVAISLLISGIVGGIEFLARR